MLAIFGLFMGYGRQGFGWKVAASIGNDNVKEPTEDGISNLIETVITLVVGEGRRVSKQEEGESRAGMPP